MRTVSTTVANKTPIISVAIGDKALMFELVLLDMSVAKFEGSWIMFVYCTHIWTARTPLMYSQYTLYTV